MSDINASDLVDLHESVNPDPRRVIEGFRDTGYNFETAVADLIDNSISAGATDISIWVNIDFRQTIRLIIADNGAGMDRSGLIEAMRYGSPERSDSASLGKFGLGLKTSSTAFCRKFSLVSRPSGKEKPLMATWDIDHVVSENQWQLQISEKPDPEGLEYLDKIAEGGSGTVVLWDKVDRLLRKGVQYQHPDQAIKRRRTRLKEHIGMTFQRFLDSSDKRAHNINITLNGESVQWWDPFQLGISEMVAEDTRKIGESDSKITFRAYILPRRAEYETEELLKAAKLSSKRQGIYIYREERLIHSADWLDIYAKEPHLTLIRVECSFDHQADNVLGLDIKKSQVILDDDVLNWLETQFLVAPRREAERRYRVGLREGVKAAAETAHGASNNSIRENEDKIGGAKVTIVDPAAGEVSITNNYGVFRHKLKIVSSEKPGEVYVQPTNEVVDGTLWEPALIEQHKGVLINTAHLYYNRVYVPNLNRSVTVQGMDSLLWALCVAELNATTDATKEAFEDMRFEVSRILRKLVQDLPEPDVGQDPEES